MLANSLVPTLLPSLSPSVRPPGELAFPVVGEPLPDRRRFQGDAAAFAGVASSHGRDWIFHGRVEPDVRGRGCWRNLCAPTVLARLGRLLNIQGHFRFEPLEFLPGREPSPHGRPASLFCQQARLTGRSLELALALGLASVDQGRPLPCRVLYSGQVRSRSTPLAPPRVGKVRSLSRKLKLALGTGEGNAQIDELLKEWYGLNSAPRFLGEYHHRVVPGSARLFLGPSLSGATLDWLGATCRILPFRGHAVSCCAGLESAGTWAVGAASRELEQSLPVGWDPDDQSWLLYVTVPTVAEAMAVVGLDSPWNVDDVELECYLLQPRHHAPNGQPLRDPEDWANRARVLGEYLDHRCSGSRGELVHLRILLETMIAELDDHPALGDACVGASVGWLSQDRQVVHCLERVTAPGVRGAACDPRGLFPCYPALDPTLTAIEERQPIVALDILRNPTIQAAIQYELGPFVQEHSLPRQLVESQRRFLESLHATVVLPVIADAGPEPIGVVSLLFNQPLRRESLPPEQLSLLHRLATRAATPLHRHLGIQDAVPPDLGAPSPDDDYDNDQYTSQRFRRGPREGSEHDLRNRHAHILAQRACRLPNAFRAVVRLLDEVARWLLPVEHVGDFDRDWLTTRIEVARHESTGSHAILTGRDVFLDDVDYPFDVEARPIPHQPVGPRPATASAAVLIRCAGQTLGVLSVDFSSKVISTAVRTALRQLASDYALLIRAFAIDHTLAKLGNAQLTPKSCFDYVRGMVRATHAVLYLRDPDSGLYRLPKPEYVFGHSPEWCRNWSRHYGSGIAPGDALIGWIAAHNLPLRLADLRAPEVQTAPTPPPAPLWRGRDLLDEEFGPGPVPYLGIPIAVDEREVHGVLRFIKYNPRGHQAFSTYDEQAALAAAARLAAVLEREREKTRSEALERILIVLGKGGKDGISKEAIEGTPERGRQVAFARTVFEALRRGLGKCFSALRLWDQIVLPGGERRPALRLVAASDPLPGSGFPYHCHRPDSLPVRAFQTGEVVEVEATPELGPGFRTVLVKRLGGSAGTICVARHASGENSRDQFSAADRDFFGKVADIVGHALFRIEENENLRLEKEILRGLIRESEDVPPTRAVTRVARLVRMMLCADWACAWVPAEGGWVAYGTNQQPLAPGQMLKHPTVLDATREQALVWQFEGHGDKIDLSRLFTGVCPKDWMGRERAILPIHGVGGRCAAAIAMVARPGETLPRTRLDSLTKFLAIMRPFSQDEMP